MPNLACHTTESGSEFASPIGPISPPVPDQPHSFLMSEKPKDLPQQQKQYHIKDEAMAGVVGDH
ncbi:MAG: hypothetical protein ACC661_12005, partial [Verrucomicrobiales bacterium]